MTVRFSRDRIANHELVLTIWQENDVSLHSSTEWTMEYNFTKQDVTCGALHSFEVNHGTVYMKLCLQMQKSSIQVVQASGSNGSSISSKKNARVRYKTTHSGLSGSATGIKMFNDQRKTLPPSRVLLQRMCTLKRLDRHSYRAIR